MEFSVLLIPCGGKKFLLLAGASRPVTFVLTGLLAMGVAMGEAARCGGRAPAPKLHGYTIVLLRCMSSSGKRRLAIGYYDTYCRKVQAMATY